MSHGVTEAQLRRLGSAGVVLLLHLALLTTFIFAMNSRQRVTNHAQEIEVSFPTFVRKTTPPPVPLSPELIAPLMPIQPTPRTGPSVLEIAPPPPPGSITGVGRALFGCDPVKLDTLPPEQRDACMHQPPREPHERSVLLGPPPDPGSPFAKVIEERFRKAIPISRPCPLGGFEDLHGLPCFGFEDETPLVHR